MGAACQPATASRDPISIPSPVLSVVSPWEWPASPTRFCHPRGRHARQTAGLVARPWSLYGPIEGGCRPDRGRDGLFGAEPRWRCGMRPKASGASRRGAARNRIVGQDVTVACGGGRGAAVAVGRSELSSWHGSARCWFGVVLVGVACVVTACGGGDGGSESRARSAPSGPTVGPSTTTPAPSSPAPGAASASPGCVAGAATVTHRPGDASVRDLCVRPGATVTAVLGPRSEGAWPQPRSGNPMLAVVTSTATGRDGAARVTVRAARTGLGRGTWGPDAAPVFTLRLSVAAYPVR